MKFRSPIWVSIVLTIILLTVSVRVFNTFNPYAGFAVLGLTIWFIYKQTTNFIKRNNEKFN